MHPTDSDRMHCVAFVISAMAVSAMDPDIVKKFKDIRNEARERGTDLSRFPKSSVGILFPYYYGLDIETTLTDIDLT